jgi:hypothetical protein
MNTISKQTLRREAGLLTIGEMAELLGCRQRCFYHQVAMGRVNRPSTRNGTKRRRYYTAFDIEKVRKEIDALRQHNRKE